MVEVEHISFSYGKRQILKDISFQAGSGERIAIIGKNGCGKSTLLKIMAGIMKPTEGVLRYFQKDVLSDISLFRTSCGYVPQENPLMEELSVKDNLRLWNQGEKDLPMDVIRMNGLDHFLTDKVLTLSGGMKRRVSIACAMLKMPPIMLMDEPTTALDMEYREQIHLWMKRYQDMNGTLIIVTHDKEEIADSDRCFAIEEGRIIPYESGMRTVASDRASS